jgi:hypothetical protein
LQNGGAGQTHHRAIASLLKKKLLS